MAYHKLQSGLSIIEVIFVAAIVTIFFTGLFGGFTYTLQLTTDTKVKQTALSVVSERIEFIRSLSYDAVGTVSGIPAGAIPQVATTTLNGIDFTVTTLIEFIDDPADGEAGDDDNGITTDYKQAKVTVAWEQRGVPQSLFMVTNIIPRSIETDVGGGTLRVNVFDAAVAPLSGATVRLVNNVLSPAIDVTRTTNASGVALFGGAPAGPGYEISVTRSGYSTDETLSPTPAVPNPYSLPATVAEADITTMNFFIDELSAVTVRTITSAVSGAIIEPMDGTASTSLATDVSFVGGQLELADTAGAYAPRGEVIFVPIAPTSIAAWNVVLVAGDTPSDTARLVQVYSSASSTLVSDADLPGNSVGFPGGVIDIAGLDVTTYPSLQVGIVLETASSTVTPTVDEVQIQYTESETSAPNIPFTIRGAKAVGTNASSSPVAKFAATTTTDGSGQWVSSALEWDSYTIEPIGYAVTEACPTLPLVVEPGTNSTLTLTLGAASATSLRVAVTNAGGVPIPNATVTLSRPGYNGSDNTSSCGQVYFGALDPEIDYTLTVSAAGYSTWSGSDMTISGNQVEVIQL